MEGLERGLSGLRGKGTLKVWLFFCSLFIQSRNLLKAIQQATNKFLEALNYEPMFYAGFRLTDEKLKEEAKE